MIDSKIFQEKIKLDSLKKFHWFFLLSYQFIIKIQPMKSTAPSVYSPAPTAWRQSWLFANEYILIKDIPAHANPANRIPSTATTIILKTSFLFSIPKVYTKFQKKSRKIFFRRNSSKIFVKKFTSNRSSKFFVKSFTIFGITSSKFFVKFFTKFFKKEKGKKSPFQSYRLKSSS